MSVIGHGVEICTTTTRPSSPIIGQMIYETNTDSFRWWTGSAWLGVIPVGTINSFSAVTPPTGWLLCDGSTLNSVTNPEYADLFSHIGITFGGAGAASFKVPDLRGRFTLSFDSTVSGLFADRTTTAGSNMNARSIGATGGHESLQSHGHSIIDPGHNHTINDPGHAHNYWYIRSLAGYGNPYPYYGNSVYTTDYGKAMSYEGTGISINNRSTGIAVQNAGAGSTNSQNVPPAIVLNSIIKY